jgi:LysR family transcriptional regulator AphB
MRRAAGGMMAGEGRAPGDLDDLVVFVHVAQNASFVAASRRLRIPASSVSRAVARLEEAIGVPLLRRTSRAVTLTDEGRQLLLGAADHVDGLREALASLADRRPEPSGVVRVTAPAFTGATRIAQSLAGFALAHPKIAIHLDATNTIRDLLHDGFDFGIRVGPQVDADFVARPLWRGRFALVAARDFAQRAWGDTIAGRGDAALTRDALDAAPCVVLRTPITWRFVDAAGRATEVTPRARFVVNDPRSAIEMARRGLGVALAPLEAIAPDERDLVQLTTAFGTPEPVDLFVVYPSRRLLPLRVRMAIDWLMTASAPGFGRRSGPRRPTP